MKIKNIYEKTKWEEEYIKKRGLESELFSI